MLAAFPTTEALAKVAVGGMVKRFAVDIGENRAVLGADSRERCG